MMGLLLSRWQVDLLAREFGITEDEVQRHFGIPDLNAPVLTGPCECPRIPWKPHRHRYTLGEGRP